MAKRRDNYEVGYRKPPAGARFKKGQSGNPSGRPKGARSVKAELEEILAAEVPVVENGERKLVSKRRLMITSQINKAAKGDTQAFTRVIDLMGKAGLLTEPAITGAAGLSDDDEEILAGMIMRGRAPEVSVDDDE